MTSDRARKLFLEIVEPRLDDAYRLAKSLAGQASDAEDIVQEAALRALQALERAAVVRSPRAWWLSVVRNTALSFMTRQRPGALTFVGDLDDLDAIGAPDQAAESAEQRLIGLEEGERVRRAVAALPSPLRETLILREINGLNYREIAEATSAPIGTVMSRLSRARNVVARQLDALK
jgi:RNA polymerase sigma-70 factor (ECF subfamily)